MDLQVFEVPKAPMDELRILAAGAGSKMALLDDTCLEETSGLAGSQDKIANHPRAIDSSP
jgi:hypothetical protein